MFSTEASLCKSTEQSFIICPTFPDPHHIQYRAQYITVSKVSYEWQWDHEKQLKFEDTDEHITAQHCLKDE